MHNVEIADITYRNDIMIISWIADIGFGQLTVYTQGDPDDHSYSIDTECCGREFALEVMQAAAQYIATSAALED